MPARNEVRVERGPDGAGRCDRDEDRICQLLFLSVGGDALRLGWPWGGFSWRGLFAIEGNQLATADNFALDAFRARKQDAGRLRRYGVMRFVLCGFRPPEKVTLGVGSTCGIGPPRLTLIVLLEPCET